MLDREQPVATAEGRGHGVIPLCFLRPPAILEEEGGETGVWQYSHSQMYMYIAIASHASTTALCSIGDLCDLGTDKVRLTDTTTVYWVYFAVEIFRKSMALAYFANKTFADSMHVSNYHLTPLLRQPHKYIVQATVLRDSWPVNETAWPYISMIKSMEKPDEGEHVPHSDPGSGHLLQWLSL